MLQPDFFVRYLKGNFRFAEMKVKRFLFLRSALVYLSSNIQLFVLWGWGSKGGGGLYVLFNFVYLLLLLLIPVSMSINLPSTPPVPDPPLCLRGVPSSEAGGA
jgi:hypothetical protein